MAYLERAKEAKPRTKKALLSSLSAHLKQGLKQELSEDQLITLLEHLCRLDIVNVDGKKVSYGTPEPPLIPDAPIQAKAGKVPKQSELQLRD